MKEHLKSIEEKKHPDAGKAKKVMTLFQKFWYAFFFIKVHETYLARNQFFVIGIHTERFL
jgi:hypothetical protein